MITTMFVPLFDTCKNLPNDRKSSLSSSSGFGLAYLSHDESIPLPFLKSGAIRRALERTTTAIRNATNSKISINCSNSGNWRKFWSPEVTIISLICSMYVNATNTLTHVKMDILSGLCYQDLILPHLWMFISSFGPKNGLQAFLDHLATNPKTFAPEFQPLVLFCECAIYLIT